MPRLIGLLYGREETFPPALIHEINARRLKDVRAEPVRLGAISAVETCPYRVIVDRISHAIPLYREYLRHAAVNSTTYVINNPLWSDLDDRFLQLGLARRLGISVPATLLLPSHSYPQEITPEFLQNLEYPLPWEGILERVGLPAVLKSARGWSREHKAVNSLRELLYHYNHSGQNLALLQARVRREAYVRCLGVGSSFHCRAFDPDSETYLETDSLPRSIEERVVDAAEKLTRALGYEVSVVEFAIQDGEPWLLDRAYPVPDFDWWSLSEPYFQQVVGSFADLAIERARSDDPTPSTVSFVASAGPAPESKRPATSRRRGDGSS